VCLIMAQFLPVRIEIHQSLPEPVARVWNRLLNKCMKWCDAAPASPTLRIFNVTVLRLFFTGIT